MKASKPSSCESNNDFLEERYGGILFSRRSFFQPIILLLLIVLTSQCTPLPSFSSKGTLLPSSTGAVSIPSNISVELYGTFHSMGVIVSINASADPDNDAEAIVEYRVSGSEENYHKGLSLNRVNDNRFVGSLFWL